MLMSTDTAAVRHDWSVAEVESIYTAPLLDLTYRAQTVHRAHHAPNQVQGCVLLNVKSGGCPEDCAYCPQSAHYSTGVDRYELMSSIDLLTPDGAAPRFIDALAEAADRAAKEKAGKEKNNFFPVFFIIGNNGVEGSSPRDYQVNKLFKQTIENAVTVHIVMLSNSSRQVDIGSGTNQIEVGLRLTQLTGGRYEAIAAQTRLTTLLPEFATQIAKSHARQSHQYRITCQPPAGAKGERVTAATNRSNLSAALTLDGRVP